MEKRSERIKRLLENFDSLNGTKFVGIRDYRSTTTNELADHVVLANFSYGKAVENTQELLNSLTDADFEAIATKYGVTNVAGTKYGENKAVKLYLSEGKLPKEGTKARAKVLEGVKYTKTLATIRDEMVIQFEKNKDINTASAQSLAQKDAYWHVAQGVKQNKETFRYHIWAMANWKSEPKNTEDDPIVYKDSTPKLETEQKQAISRYFRDVLKNQLPTDKYRNFIVEENQLSEVISTGETFNFVTK